MLVALPVIAFVFLALIVMRMRRDGTAREMAAFDAGRQALGRASRRSPRATM